MDFETVLLECSCTNRGCCRVEVSDCGLTWTHGELIDLVIPVVGGFEIGDEFVSIGNFVKSSNTRQIKMVLTDHYGEEANVQVLDSADIEEEDGKLFCQYVVDPDLSAKLKPGSYQLYVYLTDSGKMPMNSLLTSHEGLDITIF